MRKTAITVTVTTLVLGVFGAFLRWLQNTGAYDAETGAIVPWHGTTIVLVIYCVFAVAAILAINLLWLRRFEGDDDMAALRGATGLPAGLGWAFGVAFALCACVVMFTAAASRYPLAQRLLGAFGILAGLSFPFLVAKRDGSVRPLGRAAAMTVTLFCCYWLVCCWRNHSANPVIWVFVMEILAVSASTVAFYYIAAYHYGAGRSRRALPAVQLAIFFDMVTLFAPRGAVQGLMLLLCIGMLLLFQVLLMENLKEPQY